MKLIAVMLATCFGLLSPGIASAQKYPQKQVRVVVPYAAGGNLDVTARIVAQALSESTGQAFFVDNRAGANGNVGLEQVARSAPDGYTIAMVSAATLTVNPHLYATMPYDTMKDLAPVTLVASGPLILVVNPSLPVKSVQELVAYAKANPGKLNFGTGGNGTMGHLSTELLKRTAGIDFVIVPYRGNSLSLAGLMAGDIQVMFDTFSTSIPLVEQGKLRGLATTGSHRSPLLPNLPTIAESGVRDFSADAWSGIVGPAGMAPETVRALQQEVASVLARPDIRQKITSQGNEPVGSTPEAFAETIKTESAKWGEVVKASGMRVE
jgi:tripartite-type tricarboxylate transporter receptor subunit TctC